METTAQQNPPPVPNQVLPYTQLRARKPKRVNFRLIAFLVIVSAIPIAIISAKVNSDFHAGIEHNGNLAIVNLKALGYFPFDQVNGSINEVPHKWRNLDGQKVQLDGFMWSGMSAAGQLRDFQFVYNIQKCCFNGPPLVQERVFAHVVHGRDVTYYGDFCRITGTLHVKIKKDESGTILSVYTLDVDNATELAG
ncbi:MAG TPA: hypothetical protein VFE47_32235 [Tepidisphaeraceae bacterium]|jgi:hypothetical protein|nr:hypothetical protein [Tepidisphaeraceae bacterium]